MKTKIRLLLFLLGTYVFINSPAQTPYVYSVENTGASYPAPPLPTFANCPSIPLLPDPYKWADGSGYISGIGDWSHKRAEFKAQIENYEIGTKPVVDKASQVTASYSGNTLTINITANGQSMTLTCAVSIPSGATAPYPVCIGMNSSYGSVTASDFTSRGIVGITFNHDQVTTYGSPANTNPFFRLYPTQNVDNTGQYAAWAWGVSRIIDGLEKVKAAGTFNADLNHICVTGCSYAGKMALFSGAFDERIALTIAQESGGGGATSWRYSATESTGSVEGLAQTDNRWFKNSMFDFGGSNVSKIPTDHHMLMAMCAPRALFVTGNTDYTWLSNPSCYVASRACAKIYNDLGIADRFGFYIDGGHGHCAFPSSQESSASYFLNKFMKGNTSLTSIVATYPSSYSSVNYANWYSAWGVLSSNTLNVSTTSLSVASAASSTATFSITSNTSWTVSSNQTWLTVTPTSGSNNATVTATAAQNSTTSTRSATVTVAATGATSKTVTVTQAAGSTGVTLSVSANSLSIAAAASSTATFNVTSNTSWTVSSNQSWLAVGPASGSNNATVTVTAQGNTGTSARSATVTVSATGVTSQTVTVTQNGTGGGSSVNLNVGGSATGGFSADQYYSGGSTYNNTATIDMSQITSNAPPATIFNSERYGVMSYTIPNRTAGSAQTVTLYFAETYLSSTGQRRFNVSINGSSVLSNFDIYASAGGKNKAIARSFNTTANNSGQVVIQFSSVTENPKVNGISVTDGGGSGSTLSVSATSLSVGAGANSTGSFNITSNVSWTASSNQTWLTVSPASGSNNGNVIVTAQQNTGPTARSATVTVSSTGVASQTVTVTQSATTTTGGVYLEAECGTAGSLFNITADANASNGTFATVISGNNSTASAPANATGWITLPFTIDQAGTYSVWARVMCPDANGDSYWLKMDNGTFAMWNGLTVSTAWTWIKYTSTYSLSVGSHTFTVGYREDGAKLDKLFITTSTTTPSGTGPTAVNLCSPVLKSAIADDAEVAENNTINAGKPSFYPNPVTEILNLGLEGQQSVISLYNNSGQQLLHMNTEETNITIDMAKYLPGLYFLQITNSGQTIIEKIIKQ